MAEATYDVVANLTTKGGGMVKLVDDAKKLTSGWDQLSSGFDKLIGGAGVFAGTLGGIATTAVAIGGTAAGAMIGAAGIGVAYIGSAMAELEGKSIQLSSVLAAATKTPFDVMEKQTRSLFDQFRQDAVISAGETTDFVDIASKIAGPIMGAGKSMEDLHRITKGVVEMAPSLGIDFKQAGSDVMRMLQGTAGLESPLFAAMVAIPSLGIKKAEEFNKLDPSKRIAKLEEALTNPAFRSAAAAYGNSWKGLTSTFEDVAKGAGMTLGEPLYAVAKKGLAAFNKSAMDFTQGAGGKRLRFLGLALVTDFERLGAVLSRIFPGFEAGGMGAIGVLETLTRGPLHKLIDGSSWVADHWTQIKSGARDAAGFIKDAADRATKLVTTLGGGDFATGMARIGGVGLAAKAAPLAGAGVSMVSGGATMLGGLARVLGFGGGAAAAGAGGGGAGAGAAAAGGAGVLGPVAVLLAGVAGAGAAMYVAFKHIPIVAQNATDAWERVLSATALLRIELGRLWDSLGYLWNAVKPLVEGGFTVLAALLGGPLWVALQEILNIMPILIGFFTALAALFSTVASAGALATTNIKKKLNIKEDPVLGPTEDNEEPQETAIPAFILPAGNTQRANDAAVEAAKKKDPPKDKGTKVEVTLKLELGEGNEDAIYVVSHRAVADRLREAMAVQRTSKLRGT